MRRLLLIPALIAFVAMAAPPAGAQERGSVLVIALPEPEARLYLDRHLGAVALGVYPPSRSASAWVRELGKVEPGDEPGSAARALQGITVRTFVSPRVIDQPVAGVARAFTTAEPGPADALAGARLAVAVLRFADDAEALKVFAPRFVYVIGVGDRTPVLVGAPGAGLLRGSLTRRPGIVTPYDVSSAILRSLPVRIDGPPSTADADPEPFAALDDLAARLERDVDYAPGLTKVTVSFGLGGLALAAIGVLSRRSGVAAAGTRVAAAAPIGYVAGLFVPSASWTTRSVTVVVATALALALGLVTRSTRRACGWMALLLSMVVIALAVAAEQNPAGEPALSLWADPLESWRFYGLRNHLAAFAGFGLVAGLLLLEMPWWLLAPAVIAVTTVIGSPTLGANFIGVLTLVFGGVLALLIRVSGRVRPWDVPLAAVAAAGAMLLAFASDAGAQISHGGRAIASIRDDGGIGAAWDLVRQRAALNRAEVEALEAIGYIALVLAAVALAALFVWGARTATAPPSTRAGVAGIAAAAIAAMIFEDSGLFTGAITGLFSAVVLLAWRADDLRAPSPPPQSWIEGVGSEAT